MKSVTRLLVGLVMGLLATSRLAQGAPLPTNQLAAAMLQSSNSLGTLRELLTQSSVQLMGFTGMAEVPTATAGDPLLIYTIPLDRLVNYHPPNNFRQLLDPDPQLDPPPVTLITRIIFPILVGNDVRSSLTLRVASVAPGPPVDVTWTNANWGYPGLIRDLVGAYQAIPGTQLKPGWPPFAVEIPVFDIWLIGHYNPQDILVLRAISDMRLGPVTVTRNAVFTQEAMHQLAITSQRYNGLPN